MASVLETIIRRLRARCPAFEQRVAGAAKATDWMQARALHAPFAMVVPAGMTVDRIAGSIFAPTQMYTSTRYQVAVTISGVGDERNQKAAVAFEDIRDSIFGALAFWQPMKTVQPIRFDSVQVGDQAREYSEWLFNFHTPEVFSNNCDVGLSESDLAALGKTAEELELEDLAQLSGSPVGTELLPPVVIYYPEANNPDGVQKGSVAFPLTTPTQDCP